MNLNKLKKSLNKDFSTLSIVELKNIKKEANEKLLFLLFDVKNNRQLDNLIKYNTNLMNYQFMDKIIQKNGIKNINQVKENLHEELNDIDDEIDEHLELDLNNNGIPDHLELDEDQDGIHDNIELDDDQDGFNNDIDDYDNSISVNINDEEELISSYKKMFYGLREKTLEKIKDDNPSLYTMYINHLDNNLTESLYILSKITNLNSALKNRLFQEKSAIERQFSEREMNF